ncbi:MAG: hypothetical protein J6S63_01440 [Atopobiaceae bacterium]|nr:hypothetical protein [Atopobiaceae bacterium]
MPENKVTRADINARLKKINIGGKPYVTVAQRVQGFWEMYPNGRITIEWLVLEPDWCCCKATCYDNEGRVIAEGTAKEFKSQGKVNATSFIENCESSAVGRSLGIAGYGSVESIASADEVIRATGASAGETQKSDKKTEDKQPIEEPKKPVAKRKPSRMQELRAEYLKAGISDQEVKSLLVLNIGDKKTSEYTADEMKQAEVIIRSLLDQQARG